MNDLLARLLDLSHLRPGQAGVEFGFERALPLWAWAIIALAACAITWRSYTRLEGARFARFSLGLLRSLLLVVLALLIAGPRLVKPNELEEKDWVLVLVDRSASLTIADAPVPPPSPGSPPDASPRTTREQQLRAALEASASAWREMQAERIVVWLGFDSSAYDLAVRKRGDASAGGEVAGEAARLPVDLSDPAGRRTDLNRALDQALRRAAARPLSGVVILSDGRSLSEPSRAVLRRLENERIPVFAVALGDRAGVSDVGVHRVESPRLAFTNDSVPVDVELERFAPSAPLPVGAAALSVVELVDMATGDVLDKKVVDWAGRSSDGASAAESGSESGTSRTVRLASKPSRAGSAHWGVRVRPDQSSGGVADLIASNNTSEFTIELVDRPLRVLYIDGYPRWEYRYLKNLLVREPSIASAVLLLSPRRKYLQEGSIVMDSLPRSPEEWAAFDVLVLGDVWPGVFTAEQLAQIRERVALSGMGLLWIGGEGSTPTAWRSTPMADLLPFSLRTTESDDGTGAASMPSFDGPVLMRPTLAAERVGVLRLSETEINGAYWPPALADESSGWSLLQWAQRIDPSILKPTGEVFAVAKPVGSASVGPQATLRGSAGENPLVVSMRYGAGRTLYVATDEVWRWRFARGEPFTERFYIQLLRLLGRESLARSGKPALLEVDPARAELRAPVRIAVTLLEQSLVDAGPASIRVRVTPQDGAANRTGFTDPVELNLLPERSNGVDTGGPMRLENGPTSRVFSTIWVAAQAGKYKVEVIDPLLASHSAALSTTAEVWQSDDELRHHQADHAVLERLAALSGGRMIAPNELSQLSRWLPNRRVRLAGEPEVETLWDTPLALILVVGLATIEWVGRRMLRLA